MSQIWIKSATHARHGKRRGPALISLVLVRLCRGSEGSAWHRRKLPAQDSISHGKQSEQPFKFVFDDLRQVKLSAHPVGYCKQGRDVTRCVRPAIEDVGILCSESLTSIARSLGSNPDEHPSDPETPSLPASAATPVPMLKLSGAVEMRGFILRRSSFGYSQFTR